jgi:hypothetical protein
MFTVAHFAAVVFALWISTVGASAADVSILSSLQRRQAVDAAAQYVA